MLSSRSVPAYPASSASAKLVDTNNPENMPINPDAMNVNQNALDLNLAFWCHNYI